MILKSWEELDCFHLFIDRSLNSIYHAVYGIIRLCLGNVAWVVCLCWTSLRRARTMSYGRTDIPLFCSRSSVLIVKRVK